MPDKRPHSPDAQEDTTLPLPDNIVKPLAGPSKKPTTRSNSRIAADYLQTQNRIGQFNHFPLRKHRYAYLYMTRILDSLVTLYVHFFKLNWEKFARAAEKFTLPTGVSDHYHYCAYVYLSHWANDLYYYNRQSCKSVNPLAFVERYHIENARFADRYDSYLTALINTIRPTPVIGAVADELYIPVLGKDIDFTKKSKVFGWSHWMIDLTLFQLIHQTLELKKIVKMVPISDDNTGRASWLFDWPSNHEAYAWFPFDGNYDEIDITVAYILGVACTPRVAIPDTDEWRICSVKTDPSRIDVPTYVRVKPRRKYGNSEHRLLESEEIPLPSYYEKDKDKFTALNIGPLCIRKVTEEESESSDVPEENTVPDSPRPMTRSQAATTIEKAVRIRVHDYLYHTQVIQKLDNATRFAAFKIFQEQPQ